MDVNELTAREKIKLLIGKDNWSSNVLEGKVYSFTMSDGPIGLRKTKDPNNPMGESYPSVAYPSSQVLSQTWNLDLAKLMGSAIADDAIELGVDIVLGPGVNIKRLPINGRNFEYFSEDPLLAGLLAKEYIKGVQEKGIGTSLKHYCCNNNEVGRNYRSMDVDEKTLREIYLKPFEIACEANPWTVMCSYNYLNNVKMSENERLYDILRNEFNFFGLIVSDWGAVVNPIKSIKAGLNLTMPFIQKQYDLIERAYLNGELSEEDINKNASKVLNLSQKCEISSKTRTIQFTKGERREISQHIAEEGIVLLKNDGNLLPLNKNQTILISGAPCKHYLHGDGSSQVTPDQQYMRLDDALRNKGLSVSYNESVEYIAGQECGIGDVKTFVENAKEYDVTVFCVGSDGLNEAESRNRQNIKLSKEQTDIIKFLARTKKKLIVVVYGGSPIKMDDWMRHADAIVYAGFGGQRISYALANILTGEVNPSGKLSETFILNTNDPLSMNSYSDEARDIYREGVLVGYRDFVKFNKPVLFPFGYGLSYSNFQYDNLKVINEPDKFVIDFDIENLSEVDGKEIYQIYIENELRELKGFGKVEIKAHEIKHITYNLMKKDLQHFNVDKHCWELMYDHFNLEVGASCLDIRLESILDLNE